MKIIKYWAEVISFVFLSLFMFHVDHLIQVLETPAVLTEIYTFF